jgi:hypothetical protein
MLVDLKAQGARRFEAGFTGLGEPDQSRFPN